MKHGELPPGAITDVRYFMTLLLSKHIIYRIIVTEKIIISNRMKLAGDVIIIEYAHGKTLSHCMELMEPNFHLDNRYHFTNYLHAYAAILNFMSKGLSLLDSSYIRV